MPDSDSLRIAFYDSGIGGLPYFEKTRSLLPFARFLYLADSAHFPLGEKSLEEVLEIVCGQIASVIGRFAPTAVVIACNTASLIALQELRKRHPGVAFIGTVPAIKPAALRTKSGAIAVVATARAVTDPYTAELVRRFAAGKRTELVPAPEWVEFVEKKWVGSSLDDRKAVVAPIVAGLLARGVDEIVLACTHFLFLEDAVKAVAGPGAEVIDSSEGVARRVLDLCGGASGASVGGQRPESVFYSSGAYAVPVHAQMAARFGLVYGGAFS